MNYVEFLRECSNGRAGEVALSAADRSVSYGEMFDLVESVAAGFLALGVRQGDRIAVYLEKNVESIVSMLGASLAGGCCVPINPVLKPLQVRHILRDSAAKVLVTTKERAKILARSESLSDVASVIAVDVADAGPDAVGWAWVTSQARASRPISIDSDMAMIMYTSGSTGRPKGVVLSHRNVVEGARSVSSYLAIGPDDRIPTLLPLSFDAGFSQLTTAFSKGARVQVINYIHPGQVVDLLRKSRPTCMTAVPPLWFRISDADFRGIDTACVRAFANTGGHMPRPLLQRLRSIFFNARPFLMYGLTEAFRSTYLDPGEVDKRPDSIGKAIPNARVLVLREDGTEASVDEAGELVHCGAHVALGYWNNVEETAAKFREVPKVVPRPEGAERAVWSGDLVRRDSEGYLYFLGRRGEMIKTRGNRVSPNEVEEALLASGLVAEVAAFGIPDDTDGQLVAVAAVPSPGTGSDVASIHAFCRREMPTFLQPSRIVLLRELPRNPNGKIDRAMLPDLLKGADDALASAAG
ncbi:MAG: acyl-CoA ligase (AMP-forming), exosortase A system-associated [Alphaproteobacteria bacterium]|jgi:acyl-CoA ligase (AMP-forming) (exosortase A-associated)|nr:acyl-CoA ligase (AMP-forming), exosortase A system-associated [Alphaproteobacteria bacterium]MBU1550114.1 acyl-CoA ligase (AMP-forming), exosortase A system-associated [Alphaproteobacteria bacterium]MBU2337084.1 acyl-CoA ligase (AMP-forming), exosortase A system-associated [Alphaproteobacteria bacterium]MBU2389415.1 acyl-CoA ligase (AMP-forming), exosortase A system-associated [Alphaproteobacteria bacterium]